jgi:hypothetical protein
MIKSLKLDVNDKGDTGVTAFGCSVAPIGEPEFEMSRECGVEGDNDDDDDTLSPPFEVKTDALRI